MSQIYERLAVRFLERQYNSERLSEQTIQLANELQNVADFVRQHIRDRWSDYSKYAPESGEGTWYLLQRPVAVNKILFTLLEKLFPRDVILSIRFQHWFLMKSPQKPGDRNASITGTLGYLPRKSDLQLDVLGLVKPKKNSFPHILDQYAFRTGIVIEGKISEEDQKTLDEKVQQEYLVQQVLEKYNAREIYNLFGRGTSLKNSNTAAKHFLEFHNIKYIPPSSAYLNGLPSLRLIEAFKQSIPEYCYGVYPEFMECTGIYSKITILKRRFKSSHPVMKQLIKYLWLRQHRRLKRAQSRYPRVSLKYMNPNQFIVNSGFITNFECQCQNLSESVPPRIL